MLLNFLSIVFILVLTACKSSEDPISQEEAGKELEGILIEDEGPVSISVREKTKLIPVSRREQGDFYIYEAKIQSFLTTPKGVGAKLFKNIHNAVTQKKCISNFVGISNRRTENNNKTVLFDVKKSYNAHAPIYGNGTINAAGTLTLASSTNRFDYQFQTNRIDAKFPFSYTEEIVEQFVAYFDGEKGTNLDIFAYKKIALSTGQGEDQSKTDLTRALVDEQKMFLTCLKEFVAAS